MVQDVINKMSLYIIRISVILPNYDEFEKKQIFNWHCARPLEIKDYLVQHFSTCKS